MDKPEATANVKRHAYIIMLHLRSQGWTNYTEIIKLFDWETPKRGFTYYCLKYINETMDYLQAPKINAFCFEKETECTSYVCENVFGNEDGSQPRPKEIAEYAAEIAAYPKWDEVVAFLRREAFDAADST